MKNQIRDLNGVGNGPASQPFFTDRCELFKKAGIPYGRLHDTEHSYGCGEFVNIHCIFPDFDADVNDPASYNFIPTDVYLSFFEKAGTKVFYRLGETIENTKLFKRHIYPPKDYKKWAEICEHIIMHYTQGWANGFFYDIEYWEIWNEPDNNQMWQGTPEEFYEFYRVAANHLKKRFPHLKIGGMASSGFYSAYRTESNEWFDTLIPFAKGFMEYITAEETKAPLDFFSWHCYTNEIAEIEFVSKYARDFIDSYGFTDAESILDEWNYALDWDWKEGIFRKSMTVAAMVASTFIVMQKNGVDKAMYYDAEPSRIIYCGLFNEYSCLPEKPYYSFVAFNELKKLGTQTETGIEDKDGLYSLAATDGEKYAVLLSNYVGKDMGDTHSVSLDMSLFGNADKAEIYILDNQHELELSDTVDVSSGKLSISIPADTVILIKL